MAPLQIAEMLIVLKNIVPTVKQVGMLSDSALCKILKYLAPIYNSNPMNRVF